LKYVKERKDVISNIYPYIFQLMMIVRVGLQLDNK